MSSFFKDLCCCFGPSKKDFDFSNQKNASESEANIFGNNFSQSYGTTTVYSINSTTGQNQSPSASGLLSGFYRSKPKSPRELVKSIKYHLSRYDTVPPSKDQSKILTKISNELAKPISALKALTLQSEEDVTRGDYDLQMYLIKEVYESNLLEILVQEIEKLPFEARKDAVIIFNSLLKRQIPPHRQIIAENIRDMRKYLLQDLLKGYDKADRTLHYGLMLRECIKFEYLAEIVLNLPEFELLFEYIQLPTFDVSSDAFATFKDLLTRHKTIVTAFLVANYEVIFKKLNGLLASENYVTRRQSLKLLGEILHDRRNYEVMLKYVSEVENLKLLMCQLRDKSEKIQFEAFQVFKIFIANPNKPKPIYDILCKNRDKILHFLENFSVQGKQMDDRNFNEDKLFLIEKLQLLPQYTKPIKTETSSIGDASSISRINTASTTNNNNTNNNTNSYNNTNTNNSSSNNNNYTNESEVFSIPMTPLADDQNEETESLVLSRSASVLSSSIADTDQEMK